MILAITLAACAADPSSEEAAAGGLTVEPTGGVSLLLITIPANAAMVPTFTAQRQNQPIQTIVPGTPTALTPGSYCVRIAYPVAGTEPVERCEISVKEAAKTTLALGGFEVQRAGSTKLIGIDIPFATDATGPALAAVPKQLNSELLKVGGVIPYLPGPFTDYRFVSITISEGAVTPIVLDDPRGRRAVTILPPDPSTPRSLPDVPDANGVMFGLWTPSVTGSKVAELVTRRFTRVEEPMLFAAATPATRLGAFSPQSAQDVGYFATKYSLSIDLTGTEPGREVTFGRLDVANVRFTMADGSTQAVSGTFGLSPKVPSFAAGSFLVDGAPTGHGIDVPIGDYELVVTYRSPADGSTVRFRQDVAVR